MEISSSQGNNKARKLICYVLASATVWRGELDTDGKAAGKAVSNGSEILMKSHASEKSA